jgi:hypothetical protein
LSSLYINSVSIFTKEKTRVDVYNNNWGGMGWGWGWKRAGEAASSCVHVMKRKRDEITSSRGLPTKRVHGRGSINLYSTTAPGTVSYLDPIFMVDII